MRKLIAATLFLFSIVLLQSTAFAGILDCKFKDSSMTGITSIEIKEESLILNNELEIPLEKSRVNCGHFGRQTRFDGSALGFQVILKSCSTEAQFEGHIIDSIQSVAADVLCQVR